jgi:hypothetical protein
MGVSEKLNSVVHVPVAVSTTSISMDGLATSGDDSMILVHNLPHIRLTASSPFLSINALDTLFALDMRE